MIPRYPDSFGNTDRCSCSISWRPRAALPSGAGAVCADAASAAVYLHATAGERVSEEIGQAGLLASDLLPQIPRALHGLSRE